MPSSYVLFIRKEAVAVFRSAGSSERNALQQFFDLLENYPYLRGDTTERDDVGREVQVRFLSKFKVVYWADHAVKEVRILRLDRLPKK